MIYFLKANNRIKIGYANDPTQRIPSIQTSSPFDLEVLLIIDGNYDRERERHQKFESFRKSGEWFEYSEPIKSFISQNSSEDRKYEFGFVNEDFAGNEQILTLRKRHKISLVAVQRKLLLLMFTLWQNEVYYDAEFENKKQQKHKALAAQDNNLINQFAS